MPEYDATAAKQNRWRNPVFLLVFASGAGAWLTAIGWLTWLYFNPLTDWVGGQNEAMQEILGTVLWVVWVLLVVFGTAATGILAERVAGIPPSGTTSTGQTTGKHAGWTPPRN
jgi:hypothetical protein